MQNYYIEVSLIISCSIERKMIYFHKFKILVKFRIGCCKFQLIS